MLRSWNCSVPLSLKTRATMVSMDALGPVRAELEPMSRTTIGKVVLAVTGGLGAVSLLFVGVGALVLILATGFGFDFVIGLVLSSAFFLFGVLGFGFAIVMSLQLHRTTATIHANGLSLGQSWFRRDQVLWSDVVSVEPPIGHGRFIRCDFTLRTGRRVCADRLRLKPQPGAPGTLTHHPDVQTVLSHLSAWQQWNGHAWQR